MTRRTVPFAARWGGGAGGIEDLGPEVVEALAGEAEIVITGGVQVAEAGVRMWRAAWYSAAAALALDAARPPC